MKGGKTLKSLPGSKCCDTFIASNIRYIRVTNALSTGRILMKDKSKTVPLDMCH